MHNKSAVTIEPRLVILPFAAAAAASNHLSTCNFFLAIDRRLPDVTVATLGRGLPLPAVLILKPTTWRLLMDSGCQGTLG